MSDEEFLGFRMHEVQGIVFGIRAQVSVEEAKPGEQVVVLRLTSPKGEVLPVGFERSEDASAVGRSLVNAAAELG